jgi:hemoglobin
MNRLALRKENRESGGRMTEGKVMELCGEDGIRRMVSAFYRRVREDDLIGPMYPDGDWEGSEERLAEFLLFRLGASQRYLEMRGHPRLRMRHIGFRIGIPERDRWLELMGGAMDETGVPQEAREFLDPFFAQVADFMRNQGES